MGSPAGESLTGGLSASQGETLPQDTLGQILHLDPLLNAIQRKVGEAGVVSDYVAINREDYAGDASSKALVGGAMLVRYLLDGQEAESIPEIVVDDNTRPFPEDIITQFGAQAHQNARQGRIVKRDLGRKS